MKNLLIGLILFGSIHAMAQEAPKKAWKIIVKNNLC